MTRVAKHLCITTLSGILAGCGSMSVQPAPPPPPLPSLVRTAQSRSDVAQLLRAVVATDICDALRDHFLPLGVVPPENVPSRGDEPVDGRFWVQSCSAAPEGESVRLSLGGIGWVHVDRDKDYVVFAYGVHDYVYFRAGASALGAVDGAFDATKGVAWLQFRPTALPIATSGLIHDVVTEGSAGGKVVTVASVGLAGLYADGKANSLATEELQKTFSAKMGAGFVVLYDVAHRQKDIAATGQLPPYHPFGDAVPWLVNERQILRADRGFQVTGPFAATQGAGVDVRTITGSVRFRAECANEVKAWLNPLAVGGLPALPPPRHAQTGVGAAGSSIHATLVAACPWYLVTEATTPLATVDIRLHADSSGLPAAGL